MIDHRELTIINLKDSRGEVKFPQMAKIVKASLALSHGNADVERSFSKSKRVLTEDGAQMSERTLNAGMTILDAMKMYENNASKVPITKELLSLGRFARSSYSDFLENEKMKKVAAERMEVENLER